MHAMRTLACAVAIGCAAGACVAGNAGSFFDVRITLQTGLGTEPAAPSPPGPDPAPGSPALPPAPVPPAPDAGGAPAPLFPPGGHAPPPIGSAVPPNGICTSGAGGNTQGALVRVVCSTGQFVSIDALPGQAFAPLHGGAWRFAFGPGLPRPALAGRLGHGLGTGTITALRLLLTPGADTPLEMLVSF